MWCEYDLRSCPSPRALFGRTDKIARPQLLITDGQFKVPGQELLDELQQAQWELGLEVHGLLVGVEDASEGLQSISTHIHTVQLHSNAPATVRSSAAR